MSSKVAIAKIRHNLHLLQTTQILLLFLFQSVLLFTYLHTTSPSSYVQVNKNETEVYIQKLSPTKTHHLSTHVLFHLLSAPISTLAVVLTASPSTSALHKAFLILYLPFRYIYLFLLIGCVLEVALLLYLPLLGLELAIQATMHVYVLRHFRRDSEASSTSEQNFTENPPSYREVVGVTTTTTRAKNVP